MDKKYKLIVFDWDGTLNDSVAHISSSIQKAFASVGLEPPDSRKAKYVIGLGLKDAMQHLQPGIGKPLISKIAENYRHHFLAKKNKIELFSGVKTGLLSLKKRGFFIAIGTGKTQAGLSNELLDYKIEDLFHATRCADQEKPKPDPAMILWMLKHFNLSSEDVLMVGDTTHDLCMANNAEVHALAVSYGAHSKSELIEFGPKAIVDKPKDVFDWILQNK
ncbi:MAG: HAD family hydrolase [Proteobacteria bacterium]|nr:HAD family hydrolase [Pseudomonadota bacterium]